MVDCYICKHSYICSICKHSYIYGIGYVPYGCACKITDRDVTIFTWLFHKIFGCSFYVRE